MPISRKFVLNCIDEQTCIELVNTLLENLPTTMYVSYRIRGNKLEIVVQGLKHDVQGIWALIKHYHSDLLKIKAQKMKEFKEYPIRYIVSKIRRTFPPDIVVEILKAKGYKADLEDDKITTNANLDMVSDIASKVAKILDEIRYDVVGKSTKKIVVYASILLDKNPKDIVRVLIDEGILVEDEEVGKPRLAVNLEQAIKKIKTIYKQA